MQIKFLGTGGAFDFDKGNASAIVTVDGKTILIDCGSSTLARLAEKSLLKTIDYILVTHLHFDHIGSLPTLLAYYKYKTQRETPPILVPSEAFAGEVTNLLNCSLEADLATYEPITSIPAIGSLDTTNLHKEGMTSFAYYFVEDDHLIYYSGDIGTANVAADFLATRTEVMIDVFHETTPLPDAASHTSYIEVAEKLGQYNPYVYHVAKENMPNDCTLRYIEDHLELLA